MHFGMRETVFDVCGGAGRKLEEQRKIIAKNGALGRSISGLF